MNSIDGQTDKVLYYVERIMQKAWATASKESISAKTKRSQRIIKLWQFLCARYLNLNIGNPNTASLEFTVHDKINGIVYELKATKTNPRTPLYKAVCKAIAYNKMPNEDKIKRLIFIIPQAAKTKIFGKGTNQTIPELLMEGNFAEEASLEIICIPCITYNKKALNNILGEKL